MVELMTGQVCRRRGRRASLDQMSSSRRRWRGSSSSLRPLTVASMTGCSKRRTRSRRFRGNCCSARSRSMRCAMPWNTADAVARSSHLRQARTLGERLPFSATVTTRWRTLMLPHVLRSDRGRSVSEPALLHVPPRPPPERVPPLRPQARSPGDWCGRALGRDCCQAACPVLEVHEALQGMLAAFSRIRHGRGGVWCRGPSPRREPCYVSAVWSSAVWSRDLKAARGRPPFSYEFGEVADAPLGGRDAPLCDVRPEYRRPNERAQRRLLHRAVNG
mmetsp:Transcript_12712/g.36575  ORF Transcript_12712/g.36575 Transcript_12712/m.36575 type:complete len:275 (-) Transcript_12712:105-929(-)